MCGGGGAADTMDYVSSCVWGGGGGGTMCGHRHTCTVTQEKKPLSVGFVQPVESGNKNICHFVQII